MRARNFVIASTVVAAVIAFTAPRAQAFQIESTFSTGCHERLTLAALQRAGWLDGRETPDVGRADRALVDDLPFTVPEDARDLWTLSLLLGARDNDLRGHSIDDFTGITNVRNDPDGQAAHCLRSPWDDGAQGDQQAIAECRAIILDQIAEAIGDGDDIDLDTTEETEVALAFRGQTDIPVTRFAFHAGKALHALEDGFTHTFRSPDGTKVRHVLNWVDWAVDPHYTVARDGHQHMDALDICDDATDARLHRQSVTIAAATALLDAIVDGEGGREGRMTRATGVLDEYFTIDLGCTYENDWCNAPELQEESAGCSAVPGRAPAPRAGWLVLAALVLAVIVVRRNRAIVTAARRAIVASGRATVALMLCVAVLAAPSLAVAAPGDAALETRATAAREPGPLSIAANAGFSVQRAAFVGAVGLRYRLADRLTVGIDAEWNPWVTVVPLQAANGVANFYATGVYQLAKFGSRAHFTELRTTLHLGASVLLFDLVGARAGLCLGALRARRS